MEWRGWRILPLVCYDFYVFLCGRAISTIITRPVRRQLACSALSALAGIAAAGAIENQAYVAGCDRVGSDGNGCHYRGDSRVINPQGEIIATADAHQATRIDAELSMMALREYQKSFRHGRMRWAPRLW